MSVILEVNYSKKVGLPNYSSHSHSVTLRVELSDLSQLEKTNAELYQRIQASVDSQIVNAGHLPGETPPTTRQPVTASSTPTPSTPAAIPASRPPSEDNWQCSPKQRELIEKIIRESQLDIASIETLAQERFRTGLRQLNKLQASSLIDELIETHQRQNQRRDRRPAYAGRGRP
jgi:hypothetical protein